MALAWEDLSQQSQVSFSSEWLRFHSSPARLFTARMARQRKPSLAQLIGTLIQGNGDRPSSTLFLVSTRKNAVLGSELSTPLLSGRSAIPSSFEMPTLSRMSALSCQPSHTLI